MRKEYVCQCCGMGLAFGGFKEGQSVWNFRTYILGATSLQTLHGGFVRMSRDELTRFADAASINPHLNSTDCTITECDFFADEADNAIDVRLKLQATRSGQVSTGPTWSWLLVYRVPAADWEELISTGRLVLNQFQVSATHDGNTTGNFPNISQGAAGTSSSFPATLNDPDDLGDVVLVWPPFFEDWTNKKLTVTPATSTPFIELGGVNLSTFELRPLIRPFEFVFDDDTATLPADTERQIFTERITENYATECWQFFEATHQRHVVTRALEVSFVGGAGCFDVGSGFPYNQGAPACQWRISGVWWQAFQNNNAVQVVVGRSPNVSPVLAVRGVAANIKRVLTSAQWPVYPFTLNLSLSPLTP